MPLADLYDPHKGYLVDDTCIIEAIVEVQSVVPPKKSAKSIAEGSSSQSYILHIDITESSNLAQFEELISKQFVVFYSEKSPAKGHVVIENTKSNPLPSLFHHFGLLKVRNPPYSLPNVYRITEGAGLDDGDIASRLIQSSLISSELQPFLEMPVADLENRGVQIKHQEHANALQELQLSLENSAKEASQLRDDLQKAVEEKAKDAEELSTAKQKIINLEGELKLLFSENVDLQIQLEDALKAKENAANQAVEDFKESNDHNNDELAAAKEKIINMEGELLLLFSKNVDLQIQLEDSRKAEENAVTQAVEDFKASNDHNDELRVMAINSLKQATELFCTGLKNKLPMFDPSMLDKLAGDAQASLANEADDAA